MRDDQSLFHQLKTERDMEMLKIHQASRALKMLKAQKKYDVSEEILIERIILESSAKQKLILDRIQQLGYAVVDKKAFGATGLLLISNIVVPFSTTDHVGEYYVLQSTVGLNIWLSKAETPINGCLKFSQSLTFDNVPSNFVVLLQVYRLKYDVQSSKKKVSKSTLVNHKELTQLFILFTEGHPEQGVQNLFRRRAHVAPRRTRGVPDLLPARGPDQGDQRTVAPPQTSNHLKKRAPQL